MKQVVVGQGRQTVVRDYRDGRKTPFACRLSRVFIRALAPEQALAPVMVPRTANSHYLRRDLANVAGWGDTRDVHFKSRQHGLETEYPGK